MAVALPAARRFLLDRQRLQGLMPLLALVVLFAISALISRSVGYGREFLQAGNLLNILRQSSYSGIVALGMTFVIIGGGIDLSVGSMMAFVGVLAVATLNAAGGGYGAVVLTAATAVALGVAFGTANGLIITKGRIAPFIVTLGSMSIFRSLALWQRQGGMIQSQSDLYEPLGSSSVLAVPTPIWIWLVLAVLANVLLNRTRYGRHICAVGSNEKVAQYSAIRVDRARVASYAIVGAMVGVSAVLWTARLNSMSSTNFGKDVELDSIAAAVIGGTPLTGGRGSIWGTFIGAIILGMINNMLNMAGVDVYLQGTVKGAVIIAAVLIQRKL